MGQVGAQLQEAAVNFVGGSAAGTDGGVHLGGALGQLVVGAAQFVEMGVAAVFLGLAKGKGSAEFFGHAGLGAFVAVQFQHRLPQPHPIQPPLDDLESGHLFGHK